MGRSSSNLDSPLDIIRDNIIHQQQPDELVPRLRRINLECYCTYCHFAKTNTVVKVIKLLDLEAFELEERMHERKVSLVLNEEIKSVAQKEEEEAQARLEVVRRREIEYRKHQQQ